MARANTIATRRRRAITSVWRYSTLMYTQV